MFEKLVYAGIGSRETPTNILTRMTEIASILALRGYCLRSGGADGADSAFEIGCRRVGGLSEIYLPWRGFNNHVSDLYHISDIAYGLAEHVHPAWNSCSQGARKLHARNAYQVLGSNLETPADFVICWTPDGCETPETRTRRTGGTGQAIAIARLANVPVINLFNRDAEQRLDNLLAS